jgi:hypothetical protein
LNGQSSVVSGLFERLRYQTFGFDSKDGASDLEFVVEEMLKRD